MRSKEEKIHIWGGRVGLGWVGLGLIGIIKRHSFAIFFFNSSPIFTNYVQYSVSRTTLIVEKHSWTI